MVTINSYKTNINTKQNPSFGMKANLEVFHRYYGDVKGYRVHSQNITGDKAQGAFQKAMSALEDMIAGIRSGKHSSSNEEYVLEHANSYDQNKKPPYLFDCTHPYPRDGQVHVLLQSPSEDTIVFTRDYMLSNSGHGSSTLRKAYQAEGTNARISCDDDCEHAITLHAEEGDKEKFAGFKTLFEQARALLQEKNELAQAAKARDAVNAQRSAVEALSDL